MHTPAIFAVRRNKREVGVTRFASKRIRLADRQRPRVKTLNCLLCNSHSVNKIYSSIPSLRSLDTIALQLHATIGCLSPCCNMVLMKKPCSNEQGFCFILICFVTYQTRLLRSSVQDRLFQVRVVLHCCLQLLLLRMRHFRNTS